MKSFTTFAAVLTAVAPMVLAVVSAEPSLLIFSKTAGYRHASIPHGIELVTSIANEKNWTVEATEDSTVFTTEGLSSYSTLVFICTTGDFLEAHESEALRQFLLSGGTWLGIHAAGDYGDGMPSWYGELVGGQFASHPCSTDEICSAEQLARYPESGNVRPDRVNITNSDHPSTRGLPISSLRTDEWYSYKTNPALDSTYTVLATLNEDYIDEITPPEIGMEPVHPISWFSLFNGTIRSFYTGMGHTNESYAEPYFIQHVTGGLEWVTGLSN